MTTRGVNLPALGQVSVHHSAIYRDHIPYYIFTLSPFQLDGHTGHIFCITDPPGGDMLTHNIAQVARRFVHF